MDGLDTNNVQSWLSNQLSALKERLIGNPISALKLYDLGYKTIFGCFVIYFFFALIYPELKVQIAPAFALAGVVIWVIAFCLETATLIPKIAGNKYFIGALALISIPVLKFSSIWIGRFINDTTGVDPSELPDAVSALLVLFVPTTWLYVAFALLTIILFAMLTAGALWSAVSHSQAQGRAFFARLIVTIFVVTYGFVFADFLRAKSLEAGNFIILATEYFKDDRCTNLSNKDLVAHLESGVSVFNTDTKQFSFSTCQQ